jgi:transposase-like protein
MTSTERAVPFYCPYCGEEDLRPVEEPTVAWRCAGCLRTFAVKFVGIGVASTHNTGAVTE